MATIEKQVTVSKQGGTCINIPKQICKELGIKPGDKLTLTMDKDLPFVTMFKSHPKTKIYKIQRPIYGDMTNCFIYDEKREDVFELPMDSIISSLFDNDEFKVYVNGSIDSNGMFMIGDKVEKYDW